MSINTDSKAISPPGFDPSVQTENIAFDRAEMINCSRCTRANPPNRFKCIYCGDNLERPSQNAAAIDTAPRKLEPWERGVNIILHRASDAADTAQAAILLSLEREDIVRIVRVAKPLPIARVESRTEADSAISRLRSLGFESFSVSDDILALETPNIRISGIEFVPGEFGVKNFNSGEYKRFPTYKISLIVEGVISKTKVESVEKRRIRGESKVIDQTSIAMDDRVLDIYPSDQTVGFRLSPTGFDFSCLGDQKSLLARENWGRLIDLLKARLPSVEFVSDYTKIREALESAWPIETRSETKGMIQTGFGKREFGIVATTSNLEQFNKYSRLQRYLYETKR
ncbi:MAG: hypothetical protein ABL999_12350 [Pyrinomonadaceae bacterium]